MTNIHESVMLTNGNYDRDFERQIALAVGAIPFRLGGLLERSKTRILMTPTVVDYYPELADVTPRGWPKDWTWKQSDGVYCSDDRLVIVAQGMHNAKGLLVENPEDRLGIMFHELGHGVDLALGKFSHSLEFIVAYLYDMARLIGTKAEEELTYFTQGFDLKNNLSAAGLVETFAECLAVCCGRASRQKHAKLFRKQFSASIRAVQRRLQKL